MVQDAARREKARQDFDRLREQMRDPLLTILTILLAFWMFVLAPLHESAQRDTNIIGLVLAFAIAAALFMLSGKAVAAFLMLFGISLAAAAAWMRLHNPSPLDIVLNASAWILIGIVLIWVVGHAVFAPGRITYHRIMGAVLLYLSIGLAFAPVYALLGLLSPHVFSGLVVKDSPTLSSTMIYYSFGTLTGAGSGDIQPLHPFARCLTVVQAMIGQLYPVTLLARLVTLEIAGEGKAG
jgi:hypothetical protein